MAISNVSFTPLYKGVKTCCLDTLDSYNNFTSVKPLLKLFLITVHLEFLVFFIPSVFIVELKMQALPTKTNKMTIVPRIFICLGAWHMLEVHMPFLICLRRILHALGAW